MSERIVDACTLINLYGSTKPFDIIASVGGLYVTPQVRRESLAIRADDPEDHDTLSHEKIELAEAIKKKLLTVCELSANEFELMVTFARDLDDGEASSLAVARSRGWKLATDDKKARRIAVDHGVQVVATSELVHHWAVQTNAGDDDITCVLTAIERYARFSPSANDPLAKWWRAMVE